MSLDLGLTLAAILMGCAGIGFAIIAERRERPPGEPRLVPTTLVLFGSALVLILALAHVVSLVTGAPHRGRLGSIAAPMERVFAQRDIDPAGDDDGPARPGPGIGEIAEDGIAERDRADQLEV